jgi:hypothetical protein
VLRATANEPRRVSAPAIAGGTYPDPAASCALTDVVKETTQSAVGPDGTIQKTDVISFASPTTSPPITTCSVAGFGEGTSMAGTPLDRYLLVVATSQPINREAVAGALDDLDVTGSPREVSDRVASLVARVSPRYRMGRARDSVLKTWGLKVESRGPKTPRLSFVVDAAGSR